MHAAIEKIVHLSVLANDVVNVIHKRRHVVNRSKLRQMCTEYLDNLLRFSPFTILLKHWHISNSAAIICRPSLRSLALFIDGYI